MAVAGRTELKNTAAKHRGSKHGRTRWRVLLAAGAVLVAAGVLGWLMAPATAADAPDRHEVTAVATDFAIEYNTYSMAELAEYQERMAGLMTASLHQEFSQVTTALSQAIEDKAQSSGSAEVLSTAIKEMDATSATVLVAADAIVTNTDTGDVGAQRNFRWVLALTSDAGQWRVESFASVVSPEVTTTPHESEGGQ